MTLETQIDTGKAPLNVDKCHSVAVYAYNEISKGEINSYEKLQNAVRHQASVIHLLKILHYNFCKPQFLMEALVHTSFVNEFSRLEVTHNEQIEFLGDSVLNLLFTSKLVETFNDFSEGDLSKFRGSLINENSFYELALVLNLGNCVLLGKGEITTNGTERKSLLADAFEALFGAIYKDGGFAGAANSFQFLLDYYESVKGQPFIHIYRLTSFDAKTKLQEKTMELFKELPVYFAKEKDPEGFYVTLSIGGNKVAETYNRSKKAGEKELAKVVLARLRAGESLC